MQKLKIGVITFQSDTVQLGGWYKQGDKMAVGRYISSAKTSDDALEEIEKLLKKFDLDVAVEDVSFEGIASAKQNPENGQT